jgi:hypothetical protein
MMQVRILSVSTSPCELWKHTTLTPFRQSN